MAQQPSPAELYEDFAVRYQFRAFTADLLGRAQPRPGERVLDLACGTGIVARTVAPRVAPGGTVTGLDVSPAMLAVARARAAAEGVDATWDEGNATSLPYADGAFDLATCQQGLQFFPDKPAALRELHRVLAPGGRAVISTWAPLAQNPVIDAINRAAQPHLGLAIAGPSYSLTDADAVRALLEGAGFADVALTPVALTLRYPSLDAFVGGLVRAVAAVVPALAALPPEGVAAKMGSIAEAMGPEVRQYLDGDGLRCPQVTHVALVRR